MARKPVPETSPELHDPAIAEEVRHLAEDAVDELRHGDRVAAEFVIDEARKMDADAVDDVLKEQGVRAKPD